MLTYYFHNEKKPNKKNPKRMTKTNLSCQQLDIIIRSYYMSETEVQINVSNFCTFLW